MKNLLKRALLLALTVFLIVPTLVGCENFDEVTFPFVIGVDPITGVFNPFTATTGVDNSIIGMTQMNLTRLNATGDWVEFGDDISVAAQALVVENLNSDGQVISYNDTNTSAFRTLITTGNTAIYQTRFTFVLKNDIYFSDGVRMTLEDVFFNLYTYLDPSYMGPNQLNTLNIDGLPAYRRQDPMFTDINQVLGNPFMGAAGVAFGGFRTRLGEFHTAQPGARISVPNLVNSTVPFSVQEQGWLDILLRTYREEVSRHLQNGDIAVPEGHEFISDRLETFLHRVQIARIGPPAGQPDAPDMFDPDGRVPGFRPIYNTAVATGNWEPLIEEVMTAVLTTSMLVSNMTFSTSAFELISIIANEMEAAVRPPVSIHNIRGIRRIIGEREIGGTRFNSNTNEMFSITVNGVDPMAIWSLAFLTVAPMHIYSGVFNNRDYRLTANWCWYGGDPAVSGSNPNGRFGLPFGQVRFHQDVIRSVEVPIGAGAYMATNTTFNAHGPGVTITYHQFFSGNTVNFYRNPHYRFGPATEEFPNGGPARIHRVAMRARSRAALIPALNAREFHYTVVDAVPRDQPVIAASRDLTGFGEANMGWGYVGINASQIPDIRVRRAIMMVLDPDMTLEYYDGLSTRITRASTINNWVFDGGMPACMYPFQVRRPAPGGAPGLVTYSGEVTRIRNLFQAAGYTLTGGTTIGGIANVNGILRDSSGQQLRLTFSLPGDTTEHPARDMFLEAARLLRRYFGVNANVVPDPQVLTKLATGTLQIWAAAFGGGLDPDMFGLFHMHSRNNILNSWGIAAIRDGQLEAYNNVLPARNQDFLMELLADYIERGRAYTDPAVRTPIYRDAHDILMEMAIVLPTYQRENMFIVNHRIVNISSVYQNRSIFRDPMFNFTHWEFN
ncbi:MAG: ABC transporter substrate-binding protein [Firmicutes bacterium]|nr:ABC transporter substrate-binding protein [Bacillota bacterium]